MEAGLFYAAPKSLFLAVLFGVGFAGMAGMLIGMLGMSGRRVRVVGSLFVMAGLMVLGGFSVVFGSLRVVGGGVLVAFSCFLRHGVGVFRTARSWSAHFNTRDISCSCESFLHKILIINL